MGKATLQLELSNAAGAERNDLLRIELFSVTSSTHTQNTARVQRNITINGIDTAGAATVYKLVLTPSNCRLVQFFITLADGHTLAQKVAFPLDPARVVAI